MQIVLAVILSFLLSNVINDSNRGFILNTLLVAMIITNVRSFPLFILQATNRIKEYSLISTIDRLLYFFLIIVALFMKTSSFKLLIIADVLGRILSLILSVHACKEIIFRPLNKFSIKINHITSNISIGSKLMMAHIASLLILGVVKFGIERVWNIETFGKISLTLSISNFMMLFINALGLILFPILRRIKLDKLSVIYLNARIILRTILLGILLFYYPLKEILILWLPEYFESVKYMVLVFPIVIFEGKSVLLINTYMKTLRKEDLMLKINIFILIFSIATTYINAFLLQNLEATILLIVILLASKTIISEVVLIKTSRLKVPYDFLWEIILAIVFIGSGWFMDTYISITIYGTVYLVYLLNQRKSLIDAIAFFKKYI